MRFEAVLQCQDTNHIDESCRGAGHLFICRSRVSCGAGIITGGFVDDRVGEESGLRTELKCQALS